jgi:hypothetical protein
VSFSQEANDCLDWLISRKENFSQIVEAGFRETDLFKQFEKESKKK